MFSFVQKKSRLSLVKGNMNVPPLTTSSFFTFSPSIMGSTSSPATSRSDKHYYNRKNNNNGNAKLRVSLSPSKSCYSSPSTSSPSSPSPNSSIKESMEEVWKEISLSSFHDRSTTPTGTVTSTGLAGFQLQDFIPIRASPSNILSTSTSSRARMTNGRDIDGNINAAAAVSKVCPATALRLNSRSGLLGHGGGPSVSLGPPLNHYNSQLSETLGTRSGFTITGKKRVFENGSPCDDKRHKRLMKNRESAARSRARKQAHTNELEVEVIRLQNENARLRRQVQQFLAAPAQLPKKQTLRRTLTAPL